MEQHSFSITGMIWNADPVVKGVLALLALASVACWAIVFEKFIRLRRLNRDLAQLDAVAEGGTLPPAARGVAAVLLVASGGRVSTQRAVKPRTEPRAAKVAAISAHASKRPCVRH